MLFRASKSNPTLRITQSQAGLTLVEVAFSAAILTGFCVISILAFTSFNRYASNVRYETLALSVAQERMDEIMTSPCTTNSTSTLGPTLSLSGTTVSPNSSNIYTSITENSLPLNHDGYNLTRTTILSGSTSQPLTITLSGTTAAGAEDTQVIDTRTTDFEAVSGNVRMMKVTVTVKYVYRSGTTSIALKSIRATDNF